MSRETNCDGKGKKEIKPETLLVRPIMVIATAGGCAHSTGGGPVAIVSNAAVQVPAADSTPAHETFTIESIAVGEKRMTNIYLPPQYRRAGKKVPVLYTRNHRRIPGWFIHHGNFSR